jgi:hypothetical protein
MGHYPPNCYPGQGWQMLETGNWEASLGGSSPVRVPEYEFIAVRGAVTEGLWVRNAMLLPGDGLGRDMTDVQKLARKVTRRYYGAGQVQFVFPHNYTVEERERITAEMLQIYGEVLSMVSGPVESAGVGTTAREGEKREVP